MASTAVSVEDVSKRFRLYHQKYTSLKERIIHAGRVPFEDLWALKDVAFEVAEGETVGILGRNGSGKSTLLKCICGILQPTSGRVVLQGKLAGLLELGAGFQPELSGRENIYMNGSMLGISRRDVDKMFDSIVEFAELGQFIDNQVKFYSSGMYVRLGFAVAVNVDPDVLVVDEVLAVGDERFQQKCLERIKEFQKQGRTILFVSHSPDLVRSICDRAVVLSKGAMIGMGTPGEAVRIFREELMAAGDVLNLPDLPTLQDESVGLPDATFAGMAPAADNGDHRPVHLRGITLVKAEGDARPYIVPGESVTFHVEFEASRAVQRAVFQLEVRGGDGSLIFRTDTAVVGVDGDLAQGPGSIDFSLDSVPLADGTYQVCIGVETPKGMSDWREPACQFEVMNPSRTLGIVTMPVRAAITQAS
ncbi:MAG: ABC transporter ATP-binding protein [Acidimicrobiales bacterium]